MSGKIMGQVWDLELPHAHMLILLAYADHADHEGNNVYPGLGLVAWKAGYSLRQAQRITDELVAWGLLVEIEAEPGKVAHYRINLAAGKPKATYKGRQKVTRVKKSPVTFSTPTHDILTAQPMTFEKNTKGPNDAAASAKTPRAARTNHHHEPSINHDDGVGDARTLDFLIDQGIGAAAEFAHLPIEAIRADYEARSASGQTNATIVKAWRNKAPETGKPYERPSNGRPERRAAPPARNGRHDTRDRAGRSVPNPERDAEYDRQIAEWERQAAERRR